MVKEKYYIATKFEDTDMFQRIKDIVDQTCLFELSIDWTKHKKVKPFSDNQMLCLKQSKEDTDGISDSRVFVMAYDGKKGSGMFFELGYAYAIAKHFNTLAIFVVYDENNYTAEDILDLSMFMSLDRIQVGSISEFKTMLDKLKE